MLDLDVSAVGIVSSVFQQDGRVEPAMGRVLPVDIARRFLETVQAGTAVWNGLPRAAFEPELRAAQEAADAGKWEAARKLVTVEGVWTSLHVAMDDLKLDRLFVVYPGGQSLKLPGWAELLSIQHLPARLNEVAVAGAN